MFSGLGLVMAKDRRLGRLSWSLQETQDALFCIDAKLSTNCSEICHIISDLFMWVMLLGEKTIIVMPI